MSKIGPRTFGLFKTDICEANFVWKVKIMHIDIPLWAPYISLSVLNLCFLWLLCPNLPGWFFKLTSILL